MFSREAAEALRAKGYPATASSTWFDERIFRVDDGNRNIDAIWIGRLEAPKDPILAIHTLKKLLHLKPSARAVVVGDGTQAPVVRRESSGEARLSCMGAVSQPEIAKMLGASRVLLMTSHFEGSPIVLYEALASGVAVVATVSADPDNVIVDGINGYRIESRDPALLANAIIMATQISPDGIALSVADKSSKLIAAGLWAEIMATESA